jgi:hypothetical protein
MRRLAILVVAVLCAGCGNGGVKYANTYPGVAGHHWLPLAGSVHDPSAAGTTVTCEGCHNGNSFAQFDCVGCHAQAATDPLHAGVTGYTWTSAGCYQCHPDGNGSMPDHIRFFPIGAGTQHSLACSQCHTDATHRTDLTLLACASCHAAISGFSTKHAAVKDYDATSPGCVRCHGDAQVDRVAAHTTFLIASGSPTHDTACLHCHDANRTGDKAFAADFSAANCLGCHTNPATDTAHAGVQGYVYASASCLSCHPNGTGGAPADHETAAFPRAAGTAHAGIACNQCHTDMSQPRNPAMFACATCHNTIAGFSTKHTISGYGIAVTVTACNAGAPQTTPVDMTVSQNCLKCHADSQVNRLATHPGGDSGLGDNGSHNRAGCFTCHQAARTDKTFGIDFSQSGARGSATSSCAICHNTGCARGN